MRPPSLGRSCRLHPPLHPQLLTSPSYRLFAALGQLRQISGNYRNDVSTHTIVRDHRRARHTSLPTSNGLGHGHIRSRRRVHEHHPQRRSHVSTLPPETDGGDPSTASPPLIELPKSPESSASPSTSDHPSSDPSLASHSGRPPPTTRSALRRVRTSRRGSTIDKSTTTGRSIVRRGTARVLPPRVPHPSRPLVSTSSAAEGLATLQDHAAAAAEQFVALRTEAAAAAQELARLRAETATAAEEMAALRSQPAAAAPLAETPSTDPTTHVRPASAAPGESSWRFCKSFKTSSREPPASDEAGQSSRKDLTTRAPRASSKLLREPLTVRDIFRDTNFPIVALTTSAGPIKPDSGAQPTLVGMTLSSFTPLSLGPDGDPLISFNIKLPSTTYSALKTKTRSGGGRSFVIHFLTRSRRGMAVAHVLSTLSKPSPGANDAGETTTSEALGDGLSEEVRQRLRRHGVHLGARRRAGAAAAAVFFPIKMPPLPTLPRGISDDEPDLSVPAYQLPSADDTARDGWLPTNTLRTREPVKYMLRCETLFPHIKVADHVIVMARVRLCSRGPGSSHGSRLLASTEEWRRGREWLEGFERRFGGDGEMGSGEVEMEDGDGDGEEEGGEDGGEGEEEDGEEEEEEEEVVNVQA
ncbi:MAG: hypothetical protein M1817_002756 [Caeruleum heppii]|nr:MAG: hypothetical protein M1817_002756 [Caeruleum heppii]